MAKPPPPLPRAPTERGESPSTGKGKGSAPAPSFVVHNLRTPEQGDLKSLNFKVDHEFARAFKSYAASQGVSMVDLLREAFELVKHHRGQ